MLIILPSNRGETEACYCISLAISLVWPMPDGKEMRQEIDLGEMERTNEQVQHDVGDDDVERAEVNKGTGVVPTIRLPVAVLVWCAEWRLNLWKQSSKNTLNTENTRQDKPERNFLRIWSATYCLIMNHEIYQ